MPRLLLQFQDTLLKEVEVRDRGVKIGRAPDNAMVIDNPAVSITTLARLSARMAS